jgi:hypothetical protein
MYNETKCRIAIYFSGKSIFIYLKLYYNVCFYFKALLSAEGDNSAFLSNWVKRLFIKDESPKYSQLRVHAMNVLRGLFRDANFSKAMMPFVPEGLRIAFRGLKSEFWTV